jgi:hypothetical protein
MSAFPADALLYWLGISEMPISALCLKARLNRPESAGPAVAGRNVLTTRGCFPSARVCKPPVRAVRHLPQTSFDRLRLYWSSSISSVKAAPLPKCSVIGRGARRRGYQYWRYATPVSTAIGTDRNCFESIWAFPEFRTSAMARAARTTAPKAISPAALELG